MAIFGGLEVSCPLSCSVAPDLLYMVAVVKFIHPHDERSGLMQGTIVKPAVLKALAVVAANERTRYAFDGIHFDGKRAVATDGKVLLAIRTNELPPEHNCPMNGLEADSEPFLLPRADAIAIAKGFTPKASHDADVLIRSGGSRFEAGSRTMNGDTVNVGSTVEGSFPNYDVILGQHEKPGKVLGIALPVLEQLVKVAKALSTEKGYCNVVRLHIPDEGWETKDGETYRVSAIGARFTSPDYDAEMPIMPVRR